MTGKCAWVTADDETCGAKTRYTMPLDDDGHRYRKYDTFCKKHLWALLERTEALPEEEREHSIEELRERLGLAPIVDDEEHPPGECEWRRANGDVCGKRTDFDFKRKKAYRFCGWHSKKHARLRRARKNAERNAEFNEGKQASKEVSAIVETPIIDAVMKQLTPTG